MGADDPNTLYYEDNSNSQRPPPAYSAKHDRAPPTAGGKQAPSNSSNQAFRTMTKPLPPIPVGRWDLASNFNMVHPRLQLNATGEAGWVQDASTASNQAYQRDGFCVWPGQTEVAVENQGVSWVCSADTDAGRLLVSKRDTVSLSNFEKRLFVFERAVMSDPMRPPLKPGDDRERRLTIKPQSLNIWTISGTDVRQVEVHKDDVVVLSPKRCRLWNMAKGKLLWEKVGAGHWICGFTPEFVLLKGGNYELRSRKNGHLHYHFELPLYRDVFEPDKKYIFDPVMSSGGLFLYKPCRNAIIIFRVDKSFVHIRLWESKLDVRGSLLLRGNLDNLELELIGQQPDWTKSTDKVPVYKNHFIRRRMV